VWAFLGIEVVATGEGSATVEMTPTEEMANAAGFLHGGLISTLADIGMARAVRTLPGISRQASFDLKLTFISPAKLGETLRAMGRVIHAGKRTVVAEGRVEGLDGKLVATASGTFVITREKE
jgi:acyl-CoA thioesterase